MISSFTRASPVAVQRVVIFIVVVVVKVDAIEFTRLTRYSEFLYLLAAHSFRRWNVEIK